MGSGTSCFHRLIYEKPDHWVRDLVVNRELGKLTLGSTVIGKLSKEYDSPTNKIAVGHFL